MRKRVLVGCMSALAVLGAAGSAGAAQRVAPVQGVVVGGGRGVVLVAAQSGVVRAVRGHVGVGMRVRVAGGRVTVLGRVHRATVRGVIVRQSGNVTFLSTARHMLVVRSARKLQDAGPPTTPAPGTVVQETVDIDDQGGLQGEQEHQLGQAGQVQVTAAVAAVGAGTVTLTVNGQQVTIPLPAGLTLPASLVGQQVTLNLSFGSGQAVAQDDQGGDDGNGSVQPGTTTIPVGGTAPQPQSTPPGGDRHGDGGGGGGGGDD
jgi:hypothetical protein